MTSLPSFIIEIHPKKADYDPLAHQVEALLREAGEPTPTAVVSTSRLYRIEGALLVEEVQNVASTLLVDPVVERYAIESKGAKGAAKTGTKWVVDVWPKRGVTDPVGQTVEKGLRDMGFKGEVKASAAIRYLFPRLKRLKNFRGFAKRYLGNELVHDINIRKTT